MASLSSSELDLIARTIGRHYQRPRTERVAVRPPPRKRQIQQMRKVMRPVVCQRTVDVGPHPAVWGAGALGVLLAALLAISAGPVPAIVAGAVVVLVTALGLHRVRRTETRELTVEEEVQEPVTVEVEEEQLEEYVDREIPNATRVTAIARMHLPFLAVPVPGGRLVFDPHGLERALDLSLVRPKQPLAVWDTARRIDGLLDEARTVLGESAHAFETHPESEQDGEVVLRGEEMELRELYDTLRTDLQATERTEFSIPWLPPDSPLLARVVPAPGWRPPGIDTTAVGRLLETLHGPAGGKLDRMLQHRVRAWPARQLALDGARFVSLRQHIGPACHDLGRIFQYSAFSFFCPSCNADLQRELLARDYAVHSGESHDPVQYSANTRCTYDTEHRAWRCVACERLTTAPIPIHRTLPELLMPAYDRLMEENKNERLRVYAETERQERDYLNRMETEIEQTFQRHRDALASLDREVRSLEADIAGELQAIESLKQVMDSYKLEQSSIVRGIGEHHDDIARRVRQAEQRVVQSIDELFEQERAEMIAAMKALSRAQRVEDQQRDRVFTAIAQHTAGIEQQTARAADAAELGARHLGTIAANSDQLVQAQRELISYSREANGIQAAIAEKHGIKRHAKWYDISGHLALSGASVASFLSGDDPVHRALRREKVLQ